MSVAVYGYDQGRHDGGTAYAWGEQGLKFLTGVRLRLVNVGPKNKVEQGELGYPVSLTSGQSRSPFASEAELDRFAEQELERTNKKPERVGFHADVVADSLVLSGVSDRSTAYSLAEALRFGMRRVLDMELEDLQVLVMGRVGEEAFDAYLYDPMPGGSGLLQQALARWGEVLAAAGEITDGCPAECDVSCPECLRVFRNAYYHKYLDRHNAAERLATFGSTVTEKHEIPPVVGPGPATPVEVDTNEAEQILRRLLEDAGLTTGSYQHPIDLAMHPYRTVCDVYFPIDEDDDEGVCVYLDGMSIHGRESVRRLDQAIRTQLQNMGHEVLSITATELFDWAAMTRHVARIVKYVLGGPAAKSFKKRDDWYQEPFAEPAKQVAEKPKAGYQPRAATDDWPMLLELLGHDWRPLGEALRDAGIQAPDDVDVELTHGGATIDRRSIMLWTRNGQRVALVVPSVDTSDVDEVCISADGDPVTVVDNIRRALEGKP
jgi:hypothetical protein